MNEEQVKSLWETYTQLLRSTKREGIENLISWLDNETDFKTAPASTQYHNSYVGGLMQHSLNVYYAMLDFQPIIEFYELKDDTLILTALLHDLCKVNCYYGSLKNKKVDGEWVQVPYYEYDDRCPLGHGEKSVILIQQYIKLTMLEIQMIRWHMGFTNNEDLRALSKAFRLYQPALLLHWADASATFIKEGAPEDVPERFFKKMVGKNITESLELSKKQKNITIDGFNYELANPNSTVDDLNVITVQNGNDTVKVKSPYGDGLPF